MTASPDGLYYSHNDGGHMAKRKKWEAPKRRNPVVLAMMARSAKAGKHPDKRKAASKKACRGKLTGW